MGDDYRIRKTNDTRSNIVRNVFDVITRRNRNETTNAHIQLRIGNCTSAQTENTEKNLFQIIKEKVEKHFLKSVRRDLTAEDLERVKEVALSSGRSYDRYCARLLIGELGPNSLIMELAQCDMISHGWYWGKISRNEAQRELAGKPNGSFLIRDSESIGPQFTLSFRIGNCTLHYRIMFFDCHWRFESRKYLSIVDLVDDIMHRGTVEKFLCYVKVPCEMQPPYPVILKYPVSRYCKMSSLQELCRRRIQKCVDLKHIKYLPIPKVLKKYLTEESPINF